MIKPNFLNLLIHPLNILTGFSSQLLSSILLQNPFMRRAGLRLLILMRMDILAHANHELPFPLLGIADLSILVVVKLRELSRFTQCKDYRVFDDFGEGFYFKLVHLLHGFEVLGGYGHVSSVSFLPEHKSFLPPFFLLLHDSLDVLLPGLRSFHSSQHV